LRAEQTIKIVGRCFERFNFLVDRKLSLTIVANPAVSVSGLNMPLLSVS
jgi:hypothetical protein